MKLYTVFYIIRSFGKLPNIGAVSLSVSLVVMARSEKVARSKVSDFFLNRYGVRHGYVEILERDDIFVSSVKIW